MRTRLRLAAALVAAVGSAATARGQFGPAPGFYGPGHAAADARLYENHYQRDVYRNDRHVQRDLYLRGTTNPYSSPGHFYGDQARRLNHAATDRNRDVGHAYRDWNGGGNHYPRRTYFGH